MLLVAPELAHGVSASLGLGPGSPSGGLLILDLNDPAGGPALLQRGPPALPGEAAVDVLRGRRGLALLLLQLL